MLYDFYYNETFCLFFICVINSIDMLNRNPYFTNKNIEKWNHVLNYILIYCTPHSNTYVHACTCVCVYIDICMLSCIQWNLSITTTIVFHNYLSSIVVLLIEWKEVTGQVVVKDRLYCICMYAIICYESMCLCVCMMYVLTSIQNPQNNSCMEDL